MMPFLSGPWNTISRNLDKGIDDCHFFSKFIELRNYKRDSSKLNAIEKSTKLLNEWIDEMIALRSDLDLEDVQLIINPINPPHQKKFVIGAKIMFRERKQHER